MGRTLPHDMHRKKRPSYGWASRVLMNRENASSAFLVAVDLLVFFLIIIFVVFADIDCQEFLIEDMYSPHDVLDLLQGCAVGDVEQMAVEFIPSLYDSLSCG
jgi:hypothetical protein